MYFMRGMISNLFIHCMICSTPNTVKIRIAAARALRRSACTLGVAACVMLFEGARRISAASRDVVVEGCVRGGEVR